MTIFKRAVSLRVLVMASICLSILSLAFIMGFQAFKGMESAITSATELTIKQIAETVALDIRIKVSPLQNSLKILNFDGITTAKTLAERKKHLPVFAEILNDNPISSAIFIGYDTGEFVALSKTAHHYIQILEFPDNAAYLFQTQTLTPKKTFSVEYCFYDADLQLIGNCESDNSFSFDPRQRPWYTSALNNKSVVITPPYLFYSANEIGITLAKKTWKNNGVIGIDTTTKRLNTFLSNENSSKSTSIGSVIGIDATADDLSKLLNTMNITPNTKLVLVDADKKIIAFSDTAIADLPPKKQIKLTDISTLDFHLFNDLLDKKNTENTLLPHSYNAKKWYGMASSISAPSNNLYTLLIAIPADELLAQAKATMYRQGLIAIFTVIILLIASLKFGNRITKPIQTLTKQVEALSEFNFENSIGIKSNVQEVQQLSSVLENMSHTINNFIHISLALNKEQNLESMLHQVLHELLQMVHMKSGAVYLYDGSNHALHLAAAEGSTYTESVVLPQDILAKDDLLEEYLRQEVKSVGNLNSILRNRENELIGVLTIYSNDYSTQLTQFLESISGSAAIAIETRQLIHAHKALLDSMIKLIADAIDAKSHYTGKHCHRVPELALLIIEHLQNTNIQPFTDFAMSKAQEEEFRIAAWLHDCGKITTPEYVVDKATKLETIYNRIHEIRTRFEVLHRDAEIACLKAILAGAPPETAWNECRATQTKLQADFKFIGKCNIGSEFMQEDDVIRLEELAKKTWTRHFDINVGLSSDETRRIKNEPAELPVQEQLLADKLMHIIPWNNYIPAVQSSDQRNKWGFDMVLPQNMYNYGELYNLSIRKGTLTVEERFKINEHIVQTINMLKNLPLPGYLKRVPDIAGNHHEKMDGTGYPRRLKAKDMSIAERVMAVADVFEALTAADRPYKEGKKLSEALQILSNMGRSGHLDPHLINFFLASGVYAEYSAKYLHPAQLETVNIEDYLITIENNDPTK